MVLPRLVSAGARALLILVCALSLASIPEQWPRISALAGAVLAAAAIGSAASFGWHEYREPRYEFQLDMLSAAQWSRSNTPPDAVVGSFNAGIVGYFSGRETVNLDGVVDGDALGAIRDRRLLAYADARCITHLADFPFYLFWYQRYWGGDSVYVRITPVAAFSEATSRQPEAIAVDFTLWRYAAAARAEKPPDNAGGRRSATPRVPRWVAAERQRAGAAGPDRPQHQPSRPNVLVCGVASRPRRRASSPCIARKGGDRTHRRSANTQYACNIARVS